MRYRLNADHLHTGQGPAPGWTRLQLPGEIGDCHVDRLRIEDGIDLVYSAYAPRHDLVEESVMRREAPLLTITVGLEGESAYRGGGRRPSGFGFRAGHTTVTVFGETRGERLYRGGCAVRQLRLAMEASALKRYALEGLLEHGADAGPARQLAFGPSHPTIARLGRLLSLANLQGGAGPLELRIAALSLLSEQARQLAAVAPPSLHGDEDERLHRARAILQQRYDQPLTVAALCALVGMNEFTLKQGFRRLFDTSPHRMLTAIRMQRASVLLEAGEAVSRVAYLCGFRHPGNFSTAYLRFFGHPPSATRQQRARE